ncbi:MAG: Hpt domain-containing protein [Treponema sp.]|jgi:HPt (histidine-containing phosphotransfer) domain-containing protein|nr:Hpt domain-containing protein [Treponema sp.]
MTNVKKSALEPQFPDISGIDTAKGIAMTGGTISGYRKVLSMFCKDAKERLQILRFFLFESTMGGNKLPEKHLSSFTTQVHALKSASASLGAEEISTEAGRLEKAGKARDLAFIWENLSGFIEQLAELAENIRSALQLPPGEFDQSPDGLEPQESGFSPLIPLFQKLDEALKSQNTTNIDRLLDELNEKPVDQKTKTALEQISDQVLMAEFNSAIKTIDELIKQSNP